MDEDPYQACDSAVAILIINDQDLNTINVEVEVSDPNANPDDPYATINKVEFHIDEERGSPV